METAIGLAFEKLVRPGIIDLVRLVELFSANPAKIFRIPGRGTLKPGSTADVTIIDPDLKWTFRAVESRSKSRNTPFDGRKFRGAAVATIVGGKIVYRR